MELSAKNLCVFNSAGLEFSILYGTSKAILLKKFIETQMKYLPMTFAYFENDERNATNICYNQFNKFR